MTFEPTPEMIEAACDAIDRDRDSTPVEAIIRAVAPLILASAREWRPIAECPYLGEPFLAALPVHAMQTQEFLRYDYALLYMDEGQLYFYDDQADTGWLPEDYTLCLSFVAPSPPQTEKETG